VRQISQPPDNEASVWSGHCIPAAADASTLDELTNKISAMALDVLPEPDIDPSPQCLRVG